MIALKDMDLRGKRVLLRVDFNVPMEDGVITDNSRIRAALPTINFLRDQGARVILMSHKGRPKGKYVADLSLSAVAVELSKLLDAPVLFNPDPRVLTDEIKINLATMKAGDVALLENTRFRKEEEENDPAFAAELASLGDVFVNDAFGTSHRSHASNVGLAALLPCTLGFLVQREVDVLTKVLEDPDRPFFAIIGGSKVSDKIGVIENLLNKVDGLIITGAMAYTFLRAKGLSTGTSLVEEDKIDLAEDLLARAKSMDVPLYLPVDFNVARNFDGEDAEIVAYDGFPPDKEGMDIGPKTLKMFEEILAGAKTIVWNGPAGVFEKDQFSFGTFGLAKLLAGMKDCKTVIGGGDSAAAVRKAGLTQEMYHISTGGGASLEFMEGKKLPGIYSILDKE